ncbi:MAG: hypothetical protein Q8N47_03675 [Bryobacterales bacterium]|nr:hypothetical protein [Bryobacterales bacterium]
MPKTFLISFLMSAWPLAVALWLVRRRLWSARAIAYLGLGLAASGLLFLVDYPVRARTVLYTTVNAQPERGPVRIPVMIQHPGVAHPLSFEPAGTVFGSVKPFQVRLSMERPRGTAVATTDLNFEVVRVKKARGGHSSALQGQALNFTPLERGEYDLLLSALTPGSPQVRVQVTDPLKRDGWQGWPMLYVLLYDMTINGAVYLALLAAGVAVFYGLGYAMSAGRSKKLSSAVREFGFVPDPEAEQAVRERLGKFRTFLDGSRKVEFPARGVVGSSGAIVCDLTFQRLKNVSIQTALLLDPVPNPLPDLAIFGQGMFRNWDIFLTGERIEFPEAPGFSKEYGVAGVGVDAGTARNVLAPAVQAVLEAHPGWCVQTSGTALLVYRPWKVVPAKGIAQWMEEARVVAAGVAGH